ncbi:MAG TPA: CBS domain-containing protein [Thermodesulfobacteriota bacterium]
MSAVTVRVRASTPVPQARRLMRHYTVRHLPVVRGARLVGIVTDHDLLLAPPGRTGAGWDGNTDRRLAASSVRDVMSRPVVTIGPDETIGRAAGLMLACKVSCLPVLDGDRLVGILTTADLLHAVAAGERAATPGRC